MNTGNINGLKRLKFMYNTAKQNWLVGRGVELNSLTGDMEQRVECPPRESY